MSLNIWEYLSWNAFVWTLNTDQMPVKIIAGRQISVCIGERSKDLVVGSKFLDCVIVFTYSLNSAKLWEITHKFVMEGESAKAKYLQQKKKPATLFTRQ